MSEDFVEPAPEDNGAGRADEDAVVAVRQFFEDNPESVFFSRQVEVAFEGTWFHWITSRALRHLIESEEIKDERREMETRGTIHLMWYRSYRYYKREAARVVSLVEEYADPNIGAAIGLHGESLVLEGLASRQFIMQGRETNTYNGREWTETGHDLDFIFERDGVTYGVEVKNTLGYMSQEEMRTKIRLCEHLGIRPLFVARMLPKHWIHEINKSGGFALILKWQLYPWTHRELASRVRETFGLPVDAPRRLEDGTIQRFVSWHEDLL